MPPSRRSILERHGRLMGPRPLGRHPGCSSPCWPASCWPAASATSRPTSRPRPAARQCAGLELVETRFSDGREATGIQPVFRHPDLTVEERIADPSDFVEALRRAADGGTAMDPEVVAQLVARRGRASPLGELTPREREVLEPMAEGRSNAAIAESMVVTEGAVEKHVSSIFGKLGPHVDRGGAPARARGARLPSQRPTREPSRPEERAMPSIPTTLPRLRAVLPDDVRVHTASLGAGATGAAAVGALAVGALAVGALAVGAMAIGRLAIKRIAIERGSVGALSVGELDVGTLRVRELVVERGDADGPGAA